MKKVMNILCGCALFIWLAGSAVSLDVQHQPIIPNLPPSPNLSPSTIPPNGDVNPYGVAFVPLDVARGGALHPGDILVANFNDINNIQGTGRTIVDVAPTGATSLFFQSDSNLGLTTALGVLSPGIVLVGSLPSPTGTCTQMGNEEQGVEQGSLLAIDRNGNQIAQLTDASMLDGPWDLTVFEEGTLATVFVSNVLNGTVTRLDLAAGATGHSVKVLSMTRIASGYAHRCDPAALVVGPTGVAYDAARDILYVASTGDNAVFAIPHARRTQNDAGMGTMIYQDSMHLHGPLALALTPNGDLISAQGDAVNPDPAQPSEIVEFTPTGHFVAQFSVDSAPGSAFGLAIMPLGNMIRFAAVDDGMNVLDVWTIK